MTCIVGLKADDGVWIGADRAVSWGDHVEPLAAPKLARFEDRMLAGFSGSVRATQVLQHGFRLPRRHPDEDLIAWMVTTAIPAWIERLREAKVMKENDGLNWASLGVLAGIDGRLLSISSNASVTEVAGDFAAEGSGHAYAMGAMRATAGSGMAPRERIMLALESAAAYCASVGGPFDVEFIGKAGEREPVTTKGKAA